MAPALSFGAILIAFTCYSNSKNSKNSEKIALYKKVIIFYQIKKYLSSPCGPKLGHVQQLVALAGGNVVCPFDWHHLYLVDFF
jgi:hypothetical protein